MPRVRRITSAGAIQHIMNRGNRRATIFRKPADYEAFVSILIEASRRFRVKLIAFSLMPNHWHLILVAGEQGSISSYMRWVTGTHVRRYHRHHGLQGTGHLYQGRYTSVLIQGDRHLLTAIRYVESNPSRARLVPRAEDWPWSSVGARADIKDQLVAESPVLRPSDWLERVNRPLRNLAALRECVERGRPFGSAAWTTKAVQRYGLRFTMRPPGRPRSVAHGTGRRVDSQGPPDGGSGHPRRGLAARLSTN
jgi:REP-associated tyrosine transposase